MNKHVELVKKWLEDKDSVSLEELKANKEAANAAHYADYAVYAAYAASRAAYYDAYAADADVDEAAYWVKRYEELTK